MDESDVNSFVAQYIEEESYFRRSITQEVFAQSGGMPQLISVLMKRRASLGREEKGSSEGKAEV
jgi:hypothetical protein